MKINIYYVRTTAERSFRKQNTNNELFHSNLEPIIKLNDCRNINIRGLIIGEISKSSFHQTELDYNTCISKQLHVAIQS